MTPELKSHPEIVAELVSDLATLAPEISDLVNGSVVRSVLDVVAMQSVRFAHAVVSATRSGILTGTYRNFDFPRLEAEPTTGTVRVTRASNTTAESILAGSRFGVPGSAERIYETLTDTTFAIGITTLDIAVRCIAAGVVGRTSANSITQAISGVGFTATITNPLAFVNGREAENEAEQFARFKEHVASFSRGTKAAIATAAKSVTIESGGVIIEKVAQVLVREPFLEDSPAGPLGLVQVYIDNGGGTASSALVSKVEQVLRGYVENDVTYKGWIGAGIDIEVLAVVSQVLNVSAFIVLSSRFDKATVKTATVAAITTYLQSLPVFGTAYVSEMQAAALDVEGVIDVRVTVPPANVTPASISRIVPGTITVQEDT